VIGVRLAVIVAFCLAFTGVVAPATVGPTGLRPPIVTPPPQELRWSEEVLAAKRSAKHIVTGDVEDERRLATVTGLLIPVADAWYHGHFRFFLVDDDEDNAYVEWGPIVYVDKTLVQDSPNREELAAVICHEVSHAIRHDGYLDEVHKTATDNSIRARIAGVIGRAQRALHGQLRSEVDVATKTVRGAFAAGHTRKEETMADLTGVDLCAEAGINPWGMIWIFRRYQGSGIHLHLPTIWGDHPDFGRRIADVKKHLLANPELFGGWSPKLPPTPL
jgi:predicted Zn-dependent protease